MAQTPTRSTFAGRRPRRHRARRAPRRRPRPQLGRRLRHDYKATTSSPPMPPMPWEEAAAAPAPSWTAPRALPASAAASLSAATQPPPPPSKPRPPHSSTLRAHRRITRRWGWRRRRRKQEIRAAYRRLALEHHPDRRGARGERTGPRQRRLRGPRLAARGGRTTATRGSGASTARGGGRRGRIDVASCAFFVCKKEPIDLVVARVPTSRICQKPRPDPTPRTAPEDIARIWRGPNSQSKMAAPACQGSDGLCG